MKRLREKFSKFVNDKYGMLIFVSWVLLIVCLVIKIFGGNWFELYLDDEKFVKFCNYVDDTKWLKMALACFICVFTTYPLLCIIHNEKRLNIKLSILYVSLLIFKSILNWYFNWIAFCIDICILIVLPIIFKCKVKRVILFFIFINLIQIFTLVVRSIGVGNFNNNTFLVQSLYQVDYYLMILLTYLYNFKRKEKKDNG